MIKAYKYRLYPTEQQAVLIDKHIGCCRFIYNLALETKNMSFSSNRKNLSVFELMRQTTQLKNDLVWLKEVDSQSLQQSLLDLDRSFTNFFKGYSEFPKFKSKKNNNTFRNPHGNFVTIKNGLLIQPKFRKGIKIVVDRPHKGEIRSTTISRTPTGKYFVSVLCDTKQSLPSKAKVTDKTSVGIDLGIKSYIVTSDGVVVDNPKHLKASAARLKVLQRRASKKKKGSKNSKKSYYRISLLHEKVANQRKDFLQKLSSELIRDNQTLCLEDLNISGMVKNHKLAGSISDAGWGMFVQMCKYKAEWYGKNILQIPTFEPSTKICSNCGATNHSLTLADREWTCVCGSKHDRDINAAINIKNYCLKNSSLGKRSAPLEMLAIAKSMKKEVSNNKSL